MVDFPADRIKVFTPTTSTGSSVTLGAAVSNLFMTPAEAGLIDGHTYDYIIEQGTDFEHNSGVYTAATPAMARGTPISSKIGGTVGTSKINLNGTAVVYFPFFNRLFSELGPFSAANNIAINGSMEVDQVHAGALVSPASNVSTFIADMWQLYYFSGVGTLLTAQQAAPPGSPSFGTTFPSCLKLTASNGGATSPAYFTQSFEGFRWGKLGYGSANALPVTISFWVYATITGTMTVSIQNIAQNRSYLANVSINAANTWEYKQVTIPGDTTGTWNNNTTGIGCLIGFAAANATAVAAGAWNTASNPASSLQTNFMVTTGNVFCITGVSVFAGSFGPSAANSALSKRIFDEELLLCQRYYEKSYDYATVPGTATTSGCMEFYRNNLASGTQEMTQTTNFKVNKRVVPARTSYSPVSGASGKFYDKQAAVDMNAFVFGGQGSIGNDCVSSGTATTQWIQYHWTADARI